jgi:hypothetical protein
MLKFYTYQFDINQYKGYRLLTEKSNFACYKKLEMKGFRIILSTAEIIHYEIDTQLIRKLKMLKINDDININSKEYHLFEMFNKSKEKNLDEPFSYSYSTSFWYYDNYYHDNDVTLVKEEKRERNRFLANQSRQNNRKAKQYENKVRFR